MARVAQCPRCHAEVHPGAGVCPSCQVELALCSWCRDITTLGRVEPASGPLFRARYACDRCGRKGARCRSYWLGGYCNGLARAEGRFGRQLCASCTGTLFEAGKTVVAWTLIGVVGARLKPRR